MVGLHKLSNRWKDLFKKLRLYFTAKQNKVFSIWKVFNSHLAIDETPKGLCKWQFKIPAKDYCFSESILRLRERERDLPMSEWHGIQIEKKYCF